MRELYRAYESVPEILAQAMTIDWTQNVATLKEEPVKPVAEIVEDLEFFLIFWITMGIIFPRARREILCPHPLRGVFSRLKVEKKTSGSSAIQKLYRCRKGLLHGILPY